MDVHEPNILKWETPKKLAIRKSFLEPACCNKGIRLEICRQLASKGVTVVLTSRDEKRGLEAVCKVKREGSAALLGEVVFQLDILVSDAGISGIVSYFHALQEAVERVGGWNYNLAVECLETNFYGAKRVTKGLLPLLQLSNSARIINVSSKLGLLQENQLQMPLKASRTSQEIEQTSSSRISWKISSRVN
ncbi:hypothetical protein CRG98_039622 [Punica granatum]|uniref:Uncharacterized protein n=1 Tax=Punica granatum TaxID=22663 RepID=A0A2I0I7H5_PUNGR|nr:hypothetical protein CRG98_039622 [Punica granatum]